MQKRRILTQLCFCRQFAGRDGWRCAPDVEGAVEGFDFEGIAIDDDVLLPEVRRHGDDGCGVDLCAGAQLRRPRSPATSQQCSPAQSPSARFLVAGLQGPESIKPLPSPFTLQKCDHAHLAALSSTPAGNPSARTSAAATCPHHWPYPP